MLLRNSVLLVATTTEFNYLLVAVLHDVVERHKRTSGAKKLKYLDAGTENPPCITTKKRENTFRSPSLCFKCVNYEFNVPLSKTEHSNYFEHVLTTLANLLMLFRSSVAVFCNVDIQQIKYIFYVRCSKADNLTTILGHYQVIWEP